jgi:hypothetical protein
VAAAAATLAARLAASKERAEGRRAERGW